MASLLNNSSFLFNPAGSIISYQEDKVYSVLPNDGSVDGAVGGNSGGGTRVNQQGYIEPVPANLFSYSEQFDNGYWQKYQVSVTANSIANPLNGAVTADRLDTTGATTNNVIYKNTIPDTNPGEYTISAYFKLGAVGTTAILAIYGSTYIRVTFNLSTGAISWNTGSPFVDPTAYGIIDVGGGWYRCYATHPNNNINYIYIDSGFDLGSGGYAYMFGAQINIGKLKPYQPTTDRLGYPPIDYKNGKGKLLQEPQRTNVNTYSQDFTNAVWGKYSVTVTGSAAISPDGTMNAAKLVLTATSGELGTSAPVSNGYTTIFAKAGNVGRFSLYRGNTSFGTEFNLYNGTLISGTGTIEPYKDGWYRIGVKMDANRSINPYFAGGYAVGDYVYIWGAQSEEGNFATSYIPTTSATVTRAATDVTFNSPGPTKAFASKPGVILYDFDFYNFSDSAAGNSTFLYNGGTTGGDYFYFAKLAGTGQMYWDGDNSGGYFFAGQFTPKQGKNKVAWYFTNTNSYWYVNGSLLYTGTYFDTTYFNYMQTYAVAGNNFAINTFASIPNTSSVSQAQVQAWTNFNSGSGGNISYYGPYTVHTFTGSATFTPSFTGPVEVLVVAGGGGGGCGFNRSACGGGGGAGGLQYVSSYGVSAGTGITVTVGAGGAGGPAANVSPAGDGSNGSNSVFGGITTIGGGGGTTYFDTNGKNGGSGGGAGGAGGYTPVGGQGIPGQGNNGGNQVGSGQSTDTTSCGGGGGAGAVGANGVTSQRGGNGGIGLPYSISGFSTYYAGGGGGGASQVGGGFGGLGGGANGGNLDSNGSSGVNYTGGGGGGASSGVGIAATAGGTGGSGIVIVRYLT